MLINVTKSNVWRHISHCCISSSHPHATAILIMELDKRKETTVHCYMLTIKNIYKTKHFRTCHVPYSLCILWLLLLLLMMCWMWLTEMNQFYITILALVHHHLNNFKMFTSTSLRDYHLCHINFRDGSIPISQNIILAFATFCISYTV